MRSVRRIAWVTYPRFWRSGAYGNGEDRFVDEVEAEGAEVEGGAVELGEVERRTHCSLRGEAGVEPESVSDLVGRCLAWPAEVAGQLEAEDGVVHAAVLTYELQAQGRGPAFSWVEGERVLGDAELEVHADVDDDAGRAVGLLVEHAKAVGGVVQVSELVHESLGVQRPAFGMTAHPSKKTLPPVQVTAVRERGWLEPIRLAVLSGVGTQSLTKLTGLTRQRLYQIRDRRR